MWHTLLDNDLEHSLQRFFLYFLMPNLMEVVRGPAELLGASVAISGKKYNCGLNHVIMYQRRKANLYKLPCLSVCLSIRESDTKLVSSLSAYRSSGQSSSFKLKLKYTYVPINEQSRNLAQENDVPCNGRRNRTRCV